MMPTLTIRDCPDALLDQLRTLAARHRRSINGEVLTLLEQAIRAEAEEAALLARIDAHRTQLAELLTQITLETVDAAIEHGRA